MTILRGGNHFSIQRIVFPAGAKMLILATDALSKFNTVRLPWQPAGNNLITEKVKLGSNTVNG